MARYQKSRPRGTKPHAPVAAARPRPRASTPPSLEDTMFFTRLRRHAKWMFVALALFFGLGFVLFGVGAGGVGVGDIFKGAGSTGVESVSDARGKTEDRPNDPAAWRALATALQTVGQTEEAVAALDRAIALAPKRADAYREVAGLRMTLANKFQQEGQLAQAIALYRSPALTFLSLTSPSGQPLGSDPISDAIVARASLSAQQAFEDARAQATQAVDAYEKLVELDPDDPGTQLELAQAAQQTGDTQTAIAAYEKFLELSPDDPSASVVRSQLEQLRSSAGG